MANAVTQLVRRKLASRTFWLRAVSVALMILPLLGIAHGLADPDTPPDDPPGFGG